MIRAIFEDCNQAYAGDVEVVDVGKNVVSSSPEYKLHVYVDDALMFVVRFFISDGADYFHDVRCSNGSVIVGCGESVHVINVIDKAIISIRLSGYFGCLYSVDNPDSGYFSESVLVASAVDLIRLSASGDILWRSPPLALDGVLVSAIVGGIIEGSGEFDPPGGWQKFTLDLNTGAVI